MDRINGTAVSVDLFGAGKDGFKDGDKANGIPATVVNAEFMNSIQEEIANVIESTSITLDVNDRTQLLQSIRKMLSGADIIARYTTTANITLSGLGTAAGRDWSGDATAGDIIFVKDQDDAEDNGWYVAAAGAWTRVTYLDDATEVKPSNLTKVSEGVTLADTMWMLTTDAPIVVGTTNLVFAQKAGVPELSALQGSAMNLKGSAPGTSAIVTYTADEIVTGNGAGEYKSTRAWNSTIDMTVAGAGGLDTGVVAASTWYYGYAITKDDGTKALIASLSAISPTLPVGYTKWARLGPFITDGTGNKYPISFIQYDKNWQYKTASGSNLTILPTMASGVQGSHPSTFVAVAVAAFVPPIAKKISVFSGDTSTSGGSVIIAPNNTYRYVYGGGLSSNPAPFQFAPSGTAGYGISGGELNLESTNIYYIATSAGCVLKCLGFTI